MTDITDNKKKYWQANIKLIIQLLVVWFVISFGAGIIFVDYLDKFRLFGYPLGFWFAEQGSIFGFVILIGIYVYRMNQIDRQFGVREN